MALTPKKHGKHAEAKKVFDTLKLLEEYSKKIVYSEFLTKEQNDTIANVLEFYEKTRSGFWAQFRETEPMQLVCEKDIELDEDLKEQDERELTAKDFSKAIHPKFSYIAFSTDDIQIIEDTLEELDENGEVDFCGKHIYKPLVEYDKNVTRDMLRSMLYWYRVGKLDEKLADYQEDKNFGEN